MSLAVAGAAGAGAAAAVAAPARATAAERETDCCHAVRPFDFLVIVSFDPYEKFAGTHAGQIQERLA